MIKKISSKKIRQKFIKFFVKRGHKLIPSTPLVPENDSSTLYISAGMHPLVPYLLGELHPHGKKLVNIQKCLRTDDILDVGDVTHNTFFEMMGYWSLGDYFKEESIKYTFNFLTQELGIGKERISVTVFAGNKDILCDNESAKIWHEKIGIPKKRIYFLPEKDNLWKAGDIGPCGPSSEIHFEKDLPKCSTNCKPGCACGKYIEISNNVFMEYNREENGSYKQLKQKNIDVGLGFERITMLVQGVESVFETDLFINIRKEVENLAQNKDNKKTIKLFSNENKKAIRIVCDHLRAVTFIISDGILPSNLDRGYILRRLIRRAIRYGKIIGIDDIFCSKIAEKVINQYKVIYPNLIAKKKIIINEINKEEENFKKTLQRGIKEFEKNIKNKEKIIDGNLAFKLYDTYGFPIELTKELAFEKGLQVDEKVFKKAFIKHQELSRKGSKQKFKGGLADNSENTVKLHTAAHLLLQALREVLGDHVYQKGSNITTKRLRFDFSNSDKMTNKQLIKVEELVNKKIKENLLVFFKEMNLENAKKEGAMGIFEQKYGDRVKVYYIGDPRSKVFFSKEICGGPHIQKTSDIGHFKIIKEQSSSAGIRRIRAVIN